MTRILQKIMMPIYELAAHQRANEIAQFVEPKTRILDLGTGHGALAHVLKKKLSADVVGIDVRDGRKWDIDFLVFDGENLPFGDKSFDSTVIVFVLHHASNFRKLLHEAARVTRGAIVIYEDTPANAFERKLCAAHGASFNKTFGIKNGTTFLSEEEWLREFDAVNFSVVSNKPAGPANPIYMTRRRMFVVTPRE